MRGHRLKGSSTLWLAVAASLVLLAGPGCPSSHAPSGSEAGPRDAGSRDAPPDSSDVPVSLPPDVPGSPSRLVFVLAYADIPEITPDGLGVGLDLDGRVSDGTGAECTDDVDYTSPITGAPGVDNQFAAYVAGLLAGMLGPDGFAGSFAGQAIPNWPEISRIATNGTSREACCSRQPYG